MALIDREKLKAALPHKTPYDRYGNGFNDCLERVKDIIETQPAIEIVRCGECANKNVPYKCALWYGMIDRKHHFINHGDDFFCSYGERKSADNPKITCLNCKYLEITLPYGECSLKPRIVNPDDTCEYAEPKEKGR